MIQLAPLFKNETAVCSRAYEYVQSNSPEPQGNPAGDRGLPRLHSGQCGPARQAANRTPEGARKLIAFAKTEGRELTFDDVYADPPADESVKSTSTVVKDERRDASYCNGQESRTEHGRFTRALLMFVAGNVEVTCQRRTGLIQAAALRWWPRVAPSPQTATV